MSVSPTDLQTSLGLADIDTARAQMLIDDAVAQALAIATVGVVVDFPGPGNLPTGSDGVIRAAAARQYLNAAGVTTETVGPYSATRPAPSGSMFSYAECQVLRRLAGRGGAFSIDVTPSYAHDVFDPLREDIEDVEQIDLDTAIDL